jgi:hypothetical protein
MQFVLLLPALSAFGYGIDAQRPALPTLLTLPNGAFITNHFDSLARFDSTALVDCWGHVLDGYSYTMDPLGLRTNVVRNLGLTTNLVSVKYDDIGQLISWSASEIELDTPTIASAMPWIL